MMSFKQFSVSVLAVAAAVAASSASAAAVSQPVATGAKSTILFDTAFLASNNITVSALGTATVNTTTGVGTLPVAGASLASSATGSLTVTFAAGAGVALTTSSGATVNLTDFVFDNATDTLSANLTVGSLINRPGQSLLTAGSVTGSFGTSSLDSVASSTTARALTMSASSFSLSAGFNSFLSSNFINPASFSYVASAVKSINVTSAAVPEPSTYALMGLGLVGMGLVARRKQQA
jgi:opacity protein-like surface antigen